MKSLARTVSMVIGLTMVVAVLGGWLGVRYGLYEAHSGPSLDEVLHHELQLSNDQHVRLASLETNFSHRRSALESEMRSANHDLANAMITEHRYGPSAQKAIERFHAAMMALQEETIVHVLAMRAVLTPDQARQFDKTVSQVLTADES